MSGIDLDIVIQEQNNEADLWEKVQLLKRQKQVLLVTAVKSSSSALIPLKILVDRVSLTHHPHLISPHV